jgi:hypothetical protein
LAQNLDERQRQQQEFVSHAPARYVDLGLHQRVTAIESRFSAARDPPADLV